MSVVVITPSDAQLGVNTEPRRRGEVALSVIGEHRSGFAWVTPTEAREFAWNILRACNEAEDAATRASKRKWDELDEVGRG